MSPGEAGFEVGAPQGHGTVTTKTLEREGALAATDDAASFYVLPLAVAPDLSGELLPGAGRSARSAVVGETSSRSLSLA